MEKTLDFKVAGNIEIQIGDESYYNEKGVSTVPQYTIERVFKDVEGEVKFSVDPEYQTPYAEILLKIKGLPNNKVIYLTDEGRLKYNSALEVTTKELGCDTASYLFNGYEVRTGSDGFYGEVLEFTLDGMFVGVYIDICGPIMIGGTMEDLHATVSAALREWIVED